MNDNDHRVVLFFFVQKLLTMLPTEEEKNRIIEAQVANSDIPLGNAEQFLLTLTSIPELEARLKLWLFKLDFDNIELVRILNDFYYLSSTLYELYRNTGNSRTVDGFKEWNENSW